MEQKFVHSVNGQEVRREDINGISENAALADDRVLAELLRMKQGNPSRVRDRGILPNGARPVVEPFFSSMELQVNPFRALVADGGGSSKERWQGIRSAIYLGRASFGADTDELYGRLLLSPTVGNHRWDLVYARVDIDASEPDVSRFVKTASTAVATQSFNVTKSTKVTVGVVQGAESASPARPSVPTDGSGSYYIPLAYVRLPHPFASGTYIAPQWIYEVHKPLPLSSATGAQTLQPANQLFEPAGSNLTQTPWGATRPPCYLPPSMIGAESRIIALSFPAGAPSLPLGAVSLIDDSIDWRHRMFKWQVSAWHEPCNFAWEGTLHSFCVPRSPGSPGVSDASGVGHSFGYQVTYEVDGVPVSPVAVLTNGYISEMAASSKVELFVRRYERGLFAKISAVNPNVKMVLWLEASGPFNNHANIP